ncbi:MAG TPA: phosphate ABC transporter permease PstA [Firmicutes bacterium]|nr:phosphate ABC transporter permease PstA [Bacillota bacterium]
MKTTSLTYRKSIDIAIRVLSLVSALIGIAFLIWILWDIAIRGFSALDWNFFTKRTGPHVIKETGMANAIVGTFYLTLFATVLGVPLGLLGGIFLSEYGRNHPLSTTVRFFANILMGTPSILIGVFVYAVIVLQTGGFSLISGSIALAIIMLPVVSRTTEDMLALVPNELRESALALGSPSWKMILQIVFRAARAGLITGVLLAIARVSGETAPLLFTAFNNNNFSYYQVEGPLRYVYDLNKPTANLTVTIFNYAMSPYKQWKELAWGGSFLITAAILFISVIARILFRGGKARRV